MPFDLRMKGGQHSRDIAPAKGRVGVSDELYVAHGTKRLTRNGCLISRVLGRDKCGHLAENAPMRKQYYFRPSDIGLLPWDVDRLVQLSAALPPKRIPLDSIRELDELWCGDDDPPT
jgi:hypothetical protein